MPDIATALKSIIPQWEQQFKQPENAMTTTETVPQIQIVPVAHRINLSKTIFNAVKTAPGIQILDLVHDLVSKGANESSVTSLISQMVRQAMLKRDADGRLTTLIPEYRPVTPSKKTNKAAAYARRTQTRLETLKKKKAAQPAFPLCPEPAPQPVAAPATKPVSVDDILNSLSVVQAKELYARLKDIFGA